MNEPRERKRGFLGRLFGVRETAPVEAEKPAVQTGGETPAATPEMVEPNERADEAPDDRATLKEQDRSTSKASPPVEARPEPASAAGDGDQGPAKAGWFQRLRTGLSKTSSRLSDGITSIFTKRKLDAATLEDLEDLLIQADLGVETATAITGAIGKGRFEKGISADEVKEILATEVERVLAPVAKPLVIDPTRRPHVVLVVGVNGTGKTTTIGKLAERYRREGLKVVMAAGDTFRAAAIDQLKIWGREPGCPSLHARSGRILPGLRSMP